MEGKGGMCIIFQYIDFAHINTYRSALLPGSQKPNMLSIFFVGLQTFHSVFVFLFYCVDRCARSQYS